MLVTDHPMFQLAHFKIPRYIDMVEEFPTTVTGKIQKFVMRDVMVARLKDVGGKREAAN